MAELPIIIDAARAKTGGQEAEKAIKGVSAAAQTLDRVLASVNDRRAAFGLATKSITSSGKRLTSSIRLLHHELSRADTAGAQGLTRSTYIASKQLNFMERAAASLSSGLALLTRNMLAFGASFATILGVRLLVGAMASFEEQMNIVRAVSRASAEDFKRLDAEARRLGSTTRFTATNAAEGLVLLSRAGFTVEESLTAVGPVLQLAQAGVLDLGRASEILSQSIRQFGLDADQSVRVIDSLIITANAANTNVEQLAEGLKFVGPVAAATGQSIEEVNASLGKLGDAGIQASLAGTNLRGILAALLDPSKEAKSVFKELGLTIEELNPATNSIAQIFERFSKAGLTAGDAVNIFQRRNAAAALVLAASAKGIVQLTNQQRELAGETAKISKIMEDSLIAAFKELISAVEGAALAVGRSGLLSALSVLFRFMAEVVRIAFGLDDALRTASLAGVVLGTTLRVLINYLTVITAIKIAQFFYATARAALTTTNAIAALNVVIKANPIGLLVTALLTAAQLMGVFGSETEKAKTTLDETTESGKNLLATLKEIEAIRTRTRSLDEEQLKARSLRDEATAVRQLRDELIKTASEQARVDEQFEAAFTGRKERDDISSETQFFALQKSNLGNDLFRRLQGTGVDFGKDGFIGLQDAIAQLNEQADAIDRNADAIENVKKLEEERLATEQELRRAANEGSAVLTQTSFDLQRSLTRTRERFNEAELAALEFEDKLRETAARSDLYGQDYEGTNLRIKALVATFRELQDLKVRIEFESNIQELLTDLQEETELMRLSNEERELATNLRRAEALAKQAGLTLGENVKQQIEQEVKAQQAIRAEREEQERLAAEAKKLERDAERGQGSIRVEAPLIEISTRFRGFAAEFQSQRGPLVSIQENTKRTADALDRIDQRDRIGGSTTKTQKRATLGGF